MIKPDVHIELWNAFNDISFNEPDHKYTDSKGTEYSSATGWIKQFEPDTDWTEIKARKAAKEGITVDELTKQWDRKSNYATNLGTQVHAIMEYRLAKEELQF
jgi:hypothetical protein